MARRFGSETPPEALAQRFLTQVAPVLPKLQWNRNVAVDSWPDYEWTRGSYSYWKVGQYTKFAGIERLRQWTCHFAGEHTSIDFQGYLNGAVETGERAVAKILSDLKSPNRRGTVTPRASGRGPGTVTARTRKRYSGCKERCGDCPHRPARDAW